MRHAVLLLPVLLLASVPAVQAETGTPDADPTPEAFLRDLAIPLEDDDDAGLDPLIERIGAEVRYVLLGEASHGTAEFYTWRDRISRRLVAEKGFRFIAVEGDWDACYRLNRYVKDLPGAADSARAALESFDRWPQWMWANEEVEALIEWLRAHNDGLDPGERVGFYGIDLYGLDDSMARVVNYLEDRDADAAALARRAYACLEAYSDSYGQYAWAVRAGSADCSPGVAAVLRHLRENAEEYRAEDRKAYFNAKLNALVVQNAESHYRAAGAPGAASWNRRVNHFLQTVERVAEFKGEETRGIVWAHNTHIGDARATTMFEGGSTNIGQLLRQRKGEEAVFAVGFSTYRGEVFAGRAWEAQRERMPVPPGMSGSIEELMHETAQALETPAFLLLFDHEHRRGPLGTRIGHRAIGVVYQPENERGNYVPSVVPQRYDALIHIDETGTLTPVHP